MAVDVSRIPNNNKFDPVREAILQLQSDVQSGVSGVGSINGQDGLITIVDSGNITVNTVGTTITIGIDDSTYLTEEVNDLTQSVTWTNVPDANITQSSVTQHEAALSIAENQISDLGNYLDLDDTGEQTIAGDIVISGDLTVSGETTYINTNHLNIGDNIIQLNADIGGTTAPTEDAGFYVNRGSQPDASFLWDEDTDKFSTFTNALSTASLYIGENQVINSSRQFLGSSTISSTVPYFTFSGDSNTGVGRATNNKVSLIAEGTKVLEAGDTGVDITGTLDVSGAITGNGIVLTDDIITSADFSATDNRFKLTLTQADAGTIEASFDDVVLSESMAADYIPYVKVGGGDGDTTNAILNDSFLKINGSTLELDWVIDGSPGVYTEHDLKMRKDGGGFGTYYEATYAADSVSFLHYASASDIDTAKIGATTTGRIRINDTYSLPVGDGTSGQVLSTNGSGDLSWVAAPSGPTTSDLQDVTDNGATTNNQIVISKEQAINTTTQGTSTGYGLHFGGQSTADYAAGITFNGGTTGTTAQAGIYVQGSGAYGTKMYISTTDSYATGAKTAISIDHTGKANFVRQNPTVFGNGIWHAGNDGAGSGLDADLVDGLHGYQFLRNDANTDKQGWLKVYSAIGASDNVRTGLAHYDTTEQAEGVGGQLVLGYKYIGDTNYTEGAILKTYKENSTSGHYGSGLKIQVRNHAEDLATKMRLSPSGHLLIGGDKNPNGTLEVFQEAVGASGFWVDANATNRSRFEAIVFTDYTRLQAYGMGSAQGHLSLNPLGNRVGVGTTEPAHKLHVSGDFGVNNGSFFLGDTTDTDSGIQFYKSGSEVRIYRNEGSFGGTYTAENVSLDLYSGSSYATRINGNGTSFFAGGNVAIGATSALGKLDVHTDGLYLTHNNASSRNYVLAANYYTYGDFGIAQSNAQGTNPYPPANSSMRFYINPSGHIGIGTTNFVSNALITELHIDKPVAGGVSRIRLSSSVQGKEGIIGYSGYNNENFIYFNTGNTNASTNKMVINDAGNLGVGSTNPINGGSAARWITVNANAGNSYSGGIVYAIGNVSKGYTYSQNNDMIHQVQGSGGHRFNQGAANLVYITGTGDMSVGGFTPNHKLDVDGRIRGVGSIRVDGGATDSPYFGLYQNGVEKGYLQYIDLGDNLRMQSDGVISFMVGTTEGGYFNSSGHLYFNQDLRNNGYAVGGDILNIRGRSNGQYIRMMGGDNGFGIVDSNWSSTLHFRNMNAYGHIYHNNGNPIQIGNGTDQFVKLTGQLKLGVFSQSQTNTGDAWFGRAGDRAAGSATIQLGTNTSSKFEIVDYAWSAVLFEVNGSGQLYAKDRITSGGNAVFSNNYYNSNGTYNLSPATQSNIQSLKLRNNANFDIYDVSNNAFIHCDARAEGSYAAAYKYTSKDSSGYGYYKEYWYDGNSYQSISQESDSFKFSCDVIAFASSDKRLKENIKPIENALDKVKLIGGYEFDWNDKQRTYEGHDIGVIAQEVEQIVPEVVTTREDGYKAVKYEKLVPLLIEAIKEQQKQIDELKARLDGSTY